MRYLTRNHAHTPFGTLDWLRRELGPTYGTGTAAPAGRATRLRLDVKESDEAYAVSIPMPGVDPATLEITLERQELRIAGKRTSFDLEGDREPDAEREDDAFNVRLSVPDDIAEDAVTATSLHGVLTVTLPKAEAHKARRIEVDLN